MEIIKPVTAVVFAVIVEVSVQLRRRCRCLLASFIASNRLKFNMSSIEFDFKIRVELTVV